MLFKKKKKKKERMMNTWKGGCTVGIGGVAEEPSSIPLPF